MVLRNYKKNEKVLTDCFKDALEGRLWLLEDSSAFLNPLSGALSESPWIMLALRDISLL